MQTWGSLLVSTGDPGRPGTGADCVSTLLDARLTTLRGAGYQYFGRYLTNTPDSVPDKCLKPGEAQRIIAAGGRIFPIFQTGGSVPSHFTNARGKEVAEEAAEAAWAYRIPANTVIYFTVDYDALDFEVTDSIIPYFQGVNERISAYGRNYRVGVYGPRNVCARVSLAGLATYSFVSDMSTRYAGNLAQRLPTNWAFDQVQTITVGSGPGAVEIDKDIVSGRDVGVSALATAVSVGDDPAIPVSQLDAFEDEWFNACARYPDSDAHRAVMNLNRDGVKDRVRTHDAYITSLAAQYKVYKALIMTPMIWESMVINALDDFADARVVAYYGAVLSGNPAPVGSADDSSTGICQIFAKTAIPARNWAVSGGLISEPFRTFSIAADAWYVWNRLQTDERYSIETALFVMMQAAQQMAQVTPAFLRDMTPSQVLRTLCGYNGGAVYGRNRTHLYYTIMRVENSSR